jgi:hypothetical protein
MGSTPYATITTTPDQATDGSQFLRLITAPDTLDDRVTQELKRLYGNPNPNITIQISSDISANVESQLHSMGFVGVKRYTPGAAPLPPTGACGPQGKYGLFSQTVVVVDATDPVAVSLTGSLSDTVIYVSGGALTQDQINFLQHSSGVLESAYVLGNVPAAVAKQVADLIAGPVGYATVNNPVPPQS